MKKMTKFFALAIVMIAFSAATFAQVTTSATAVIITPLTVTKVTDMNFGNIAASAAGGTVALSTAGVRTPAGVTIPAATPGTPTAATFTLAGLAAATYAVAIAPATVTLGDAAAHTMTVGTFTQAVSAGTLGTLPAGGTHVLQIGATLTVGANQAAGTYTSGAANGSGDFTVTVNYN
jgi:hypothetical protein